MSGKEPHLVLGSNSFSGANFVNWLLANGQNVIGVSRSPEPHAAFLPYRWRGIDNNFRFYQFDINKDIDAIIDLVSAEKVRYFTNFSAQSMVAESWVNPDHWFITNVVSTIRLHERLRKIGTLEKYVHVTTPEVYGNTDKAVDESAAFNPSTPYAVSRAAADMSLRTFHSAYDFPVVFTRAANVYGPGQQLYRIIPRTIMFIRLGRKLPLHGGGTSERSFIHISDVADATWRVARDGKPGETYHISTDRVVSIRELVEMICTRLKVPFEDAVEFSGERLGKDSSYRLDSSKLRSELGWRDDIPLERGLDETTAWVDLFFDDVRQLPLCYVHKE